jgi:photosynthetic reaction center cytochrome c subunit
MNPARTCLTALVLGATLLIAGCEAPPPASDQRGYRGQSMGNVANPRTLAAREAANQAPEAQPPADPTGPRVSTIYQNVKVLGDLSETEFLRVMASMTEWVAPQEESCAYCHNLENMADESKYQYRVARQMLIMTRSLNTTWTSHVGETGVTCYTCHRGQPQPQYTFKQDSGPMGAGGMAASRQGQNVASRLVGLTSLPTDPFTELLAYTGQIRSVSTTVLPAGNTRNIQDTERTYGLMIHMSEGLGVNCTFCHNSNNFGTWSSSPPQRATAYHGIRMVRDININHIAPLQPIQPPERLGPEGDNAKVFCTTCHQQQPKPMNGAAMLPNYPELGAPRPAP